MTVAQVGNRCAETFMGWSEAVAGKVSWNSCEFATWILTKKAAATEANYMRLGYHPRAGETHENSAKEKDVRGYTSFLVEKKCCGDNRESYSVDASVTIPEGDELTLRFLNCHTQVPNSTAICSKLQ